MQKNDTVDTIKSIARDIYRSLGSGFSEYVYDRAMQVGLRLKGIRYENQPVVRITYKGHAIGEGYPDLIVKSGRERIVVELKSTGGSLGPSEEQQVKNYMKNLNIKKGLLINFPQPEKKQQKNMVEIKEISL